jgi:hypothetical protein
MALACDMRIAVPNARFFYPVAKLGFLPQPSDPARLRGLMGPARAKLLLLGGQKFTADEALAFWSRRPHGACAGAPDRGVRDLPPTRWPEIPRSCAGSRRCAPRVRMGQRRFQPRRAPGSWNGNPGGRLATQAMKAASLGWARSASTVL